MSTINNNNIDGQLDNQLQKLASEIAVLEDKYKKSIRAKEREDIKKEIESKKDLMNSLTEPAPADAPEAPADAPASAKVPVEDKAPVEDKEVTTSKTLIAIATIIVVAIVVVVSTLWTSSSKEEAASTTAASSKYFISLSEVRQAFETSMFRTWDMEYTRRAEALKAWVPSYRALYVDSDLVSTKEEALMYAYGLVISIYMDAGTDPAEAYRKVMLASTEELKELLRENYDDCTAVIRALTL